LMVHSRCPLVAEHAGAGGKQVQRRIHLVNQRVPSSSSHSLFECRQHAIRPDARVRPPSDRGRLSGGCSRERHCHRFVISFPWLGHHASIFLHPFAPPALPGFLATMGALTPERSVLRILIRDNERRPYAAQVSLLHVSNRPIIPSPTTVSRLPNGTWFVSGAYRAICRPHPFLGTRASFGLRRYVAGSPRQPAESSSSSYGLTVHLQLLSTPFHKDAVTFGYGAQVKPRQGLPPCGFNTLANAQRLARWAEGCPLGTLPRALPWAGRTPAPSGNAVKDFRRMGANVR